MNPVGEIVTVNPDAQQDACLGESNKEPLNKDVDRAKGIQQSTVTTTHRSHVKEW